MNYTAVQCRKTSRGHVAILIAAAVLAGGCQKPNGPKTPDSGAAKPPEIVYGVVSARQIESTVSLPATVESYESVMLMARVEAYVGEVLVDIGDEVSEGQMLVRLTAPELLHKVQEQHSRIRRLQAVDDVLDAELESDRSHLREIESQQELKHSERARLKELVQSGAISRQRLEEAEAAEKSADAMLSRYQNEVRVAEARIAQGRSDVAVAVAELKQAETLADYLELRAPFDGVVAQRNVDPGNLVRPAGQGSGTKPLLTIAKIDKLRAVVYATTDLAGEMVRGNPIKFVADNLPGKEFSGTLSRMAGTYNDKTRKMRGEIDLDNSKDLTTGKRPLHAGSYGLATIVLQSAIQPVVPESALRNVGGRTTVVVVSGGVCLVTPVEVGIVSGKQVGIASGIKEGDQIVVQNPEAIKNEQPVTDSQMKLESW